MKYFYKLCPKASFIMNACIEYKCNNELEKKNPSSFDTYVYSDEILHLWEKFRNNQNF